MKWKEKLLRLPLFKSEKFTSKNALSFLNVTQFGGALNDNLYKFLTVFLLIDLLGVKKSNEILFWVGTIYVLPFLLFSSFAGYLADKFSKQRIIIILKGAEVITMFLGVIAFAFKSPLACYVLLFLLSAHSAFFGPPKYSIIPELVRKEEISKANGIITSFAYLAMIFGTFLASGLTQVTHRNFPLAISACFLVAIGGFLSSLFIPITPARKTKSRFNYLFLYQIYRTLVYTRNFKNLFLIIIAGSMFLFIGAFFQLNIIPYSIESLNLSEVGGGYLFLMTSIGIALGAFFAGKISKHRIELGLSCIGGLGISILFFVLAFASLNVVFTIIILIIIGIFGGFFVVPLDSFVQDASPIRKRGEIIAANYFLSFVGVLFAPFCLYLINEILGFKAAKGFGIVGILILILAIAMLIQLAAPFFNFISRSFVYPLYRPDTSQYPPHAKGPFFLILPDFSLAKAFLLLGVEPHLHFFLPKNKKRFLDFFIQCFFPITFIYCRGNNEFALGYFLEGIKEIKLKKEIGCLLFRDNSYLKSSFAKIIFEEFASEENHQPYFVDFNLIPQVKMEKTGSKIENRLTIVFNKEFNTENAFMHKILRWKR